nr:insulin-like receptor 2 [Porcellio dilatatus petiti]
MKKFLLLNFIILTFGSKILLAENLNYCSGSLVRSLKDLNNLRECDVIEGNLIIAFGDAKRPNDWVKYGSLRVREVTGFVVFFFLDQLESLDLVVPNLRVIRGNTLYENYALIIYGIMDLKTISLNNLTAILQGSVFIRNNPWLNSYTHRVLWDNITHWNNGPDITHMNIIQQVQSPLEMCNDSCRPNGSLLGYCWSRDVCQTVCPSSSPLSCTEFGEPCPEECVGGCYKDKNVTKCYACKHYRNLDGCAESCFPENYSLDNYRCVTERECIDLGRKLLVLQNSTSMCVKECPDSYKPSRSNSSLCSLCSDCKKTCDGSVVDSVEKAHKLAGCEIINGSLEIRVYGKRIMQEFSKHLGTIQEVNGYVYIHHSRELKSLKFLENLVRINGNELWQNKYSLVVHDNDDLEELWNTTDTALTFAKGLALFYANPKLCSHTITHLVGQKVWKKSVPDDNIRRVLNGNKRACNINKALDFTIEPLNEKGVLYIAISSDLGSNPNLLGYNVYYKETEKEALEYYGTERHWKRVFQTVPNWEMKLKLNPATRYAIFLESKTTDPLRNFQSGIKCAITKSFNPSPPENVRVTSSNLENVKVSWDLPQFPNGEIDHYVISFQPIKYENYHDVDMCNNNERRKFMEYYNEKKLYNQTAEEERKREYLEKQSRLKPSDLPSSEDSYIDETVDRKREYINIAVKLSEFISASSNHPYKARRRKRRETDYKLVQQICKEIDGQVKRSVPKGLGRNLDTVSKGSYIQPFIIENTLIESLQNPDVLSQLHDEIKELLQLSHPNPIISYNCTVHLYNLTQQLLENNKNKTELNRRYIETGVDQPTFINSLNSSSMGHIAYKTHYNIVNITSSLYEFRIMACHKTLYSTKECGEGGIKPPCKLCSYWYKTRLNIVLDKKYYQSDITILRINNNNVTVAWTPPKYLPTNEILYYTLYVQEIGNSSSARKNLHVYCENPSSNQTSFLIPKLGNYSVAVSAFSLVFNDELPRSSPATFVINKNYASNITLGSHDQNNHTKGVFVILISFAVFVLLIVVVYFYFNRKKVLREKRKKLDIFGVKVSDNPFYTPYPPWKDYLEEKIDEKYLYQMTDLDVEECKVGQGNFGVVHKGTLKRPKGKSIKVAVKKLRADSDGSSQSYKELVNEASLMLKIKCFHLVEMYGVAYTKNDIFLVMEYMENKSLKNYINQNVTDGNIFQLFTKEKLIGISVQIADGMAYLAYKNILHMDLALRNILVGLDESVKISDFGMSRVVNGEYYRIRENKPVPIRWMPPEYFECNKFTTQSDVWSYGVLLWEIMNPGKVPYENKTENEDIKMEILNNFLPGEISEEAPFGSVMAECWNKCPKQRPTFCRIVRELYALLTDKNFKNTFEKKSFYFRKECSQNMDFTEVIETDEPDDTPSTPLTSTPTMTHSHFLRGNSHHKSENIESFRDLSPFRNLHKQLSSLQTSFSKSLTLVNNFRESFTNSQNKINEVTNKQSDTFRHIPKETPEPQGNFSPAQLKKLNCVYKNGNGVVQM